MANTQQNTNDAPVEHIGPARHTLRNALLALSIIGMTGVLTLFYWQSGKSSDMAAGELTQFRQAMFNRCGDQQFDGALDPKLAELYADSSRMRAVVVKQFHQLQRDDTNCLEVAKALRSADYPIR